MSRQTSLEEHLQIVALSEAGLTNQAIAENTGWSVCVVRKWRRQYKKEGRPGLASSMGKPQHGILTILSTNDYLDVRSNILRKSGTKYLVRKS